MFKVFPCGIDKRPLINDWQREATTDINKINEWREMFRDRLTHWGIPTGQTNGVLALDIDVKDDGFTTLTNLQLMCPTTRSQRTRSGGMHLLYQYPSDGKRYGNRVKFKPGLDIRGEGGYICEYALDKTEIRSAPDWLLKEALSIDTLNLERASASNSVAASILNESLHKIRNAAQGERNNTLNIEAFKVAQLVSTNSLDKDVAITLLTSAGLDIGLTPHEVQATVHSALKGGETKPLSSPFGEPKPVIDIPVIPMPEKWTPKCLSFTDLTSTQHLRRPQLFKDWSTEDIHLTTADGGTGKTTLKLYEAVCLALGERFLGFDNIKPGKTLFITGEDSREKLGAILGKMLDEMGYLNDTNKVNTILNSIIIKKDSDLCLIQKDKFGFLTPNSVALETILESVREIKPKMIVFDPIASFWGSEAALNDMAKAVSKVMSRIAHEANACVEMINHMGKVSSTNKDMSQFAGRGGTGLPSHARVSRVMREVASDEYAELTGRVLDDKEKAIMVNVAKFSDGSPLYNKPFLVIRKGYLFRREDIPTLTDRQDDKESRDMERVFNFIKDAFQSNKYPTREQVVAHFYTLKDKIPQSRCKRVLDLLEFQGFKSERIKSEPNPDLTMKSPILVVVPLD